MKRVALGLGVLALVLALGAAAAWQSMQRYLDTPMPIASPQSLTIPTGATLSQVLNTLEAREIVTAPHWLRIDARLNDTAGRIHAGDYTLPPGMTPRQMMQAFITGAVDLERVTLIEGWTAAEAVQAIVSHPAVRDDLEVSLGARADGVAWLGDAAHRALATRLSIEQPSIEGWIYPDTYRFARGIAASVLLEKAHRRMREQLDAAWSEAGDAAPVDTPYQALVLASIIEKETALDTERARIAGVFARRLQRGMRLQTDPTVIYGLGTAYDGDIRRRDLQQETPYNTYRIDGLPPTPIALPGRASLAAAVSPLGDDDALYFVATGEGDGSHYFSATVEEHNAAVARYLKRLRSRPQ